MSLVTHSINLASIPYKSTIDRINKVIDAIKFFESLPAKDLLDLIKQQMDKYDITAYIVNHYHGIYLEYLNHITIDIEPITHACQTLWEIINELENKCKPDLINNQPLTQ